MSLSSGARLGPYEILASIGAGGMGEVYTARDTRLERTVAIKVLPAHLSDSAEVRQRFEREAKTISQLSHPHICAIYDVGREGETEYLVMEYIDGQTLFDRLAKGPLPLDQTLRCGVEIADALDGAHRQGIVHRDLKPANVMLTRSGVKLLDFGLAKAMEMSPVRGLTALPTVVGAPPLTQEGTILGTFQYMAPEQLEGREADGRTDIFAFGAVLYEMASGRKAFAATSQASLITAIMSSDPPPLSRLQPMTPPALDRVVRTCLAKNPDDRWQSASDLKSELKWIGEGSSSGTPVAVRSRRAGLDRIAWIAAGLFAAAAAALLARELFKSKPVRRPTRFQVSAPPGAAFSATLALSPDDRSIAFTTSGANPSLYIHSLDSGESRPVPFTTEAKYPFWSPDGKSVAFFAQGVLKRVDLTGGPAQALCEAADPRGGTWSPEGVIVFSPSAISGLSRIPASPGSSSTPLTQLDAQRQENSHRWPSFLPDGRHYLFMVMAGGSDTRGLYLGELGSSKRKKLLGDMTSGAYSEEHLIFRRQNALLAQPFDARRGELTGEPFSVAATARGDSGITGLGAFTASGGGTLAYRAGTVDPTSMSWMDRKGAVLETISDSDNMSEPALSPDGKRVAWHRPDASSGSDDIWIADLARRTSSRVTFDASDEVAPVWSPDGTRIAFSSSLTGDYDLYEKPAAGGEARLLLHSSKPKYADDWSPDGRYLLYEDASPKSLEDLWLLPLFGDRKPVSFAQSRFNEAHAQFSPDGRWIAYVCDESGRPEIFVQPFPATGAKWQISNGGADGPSWSRDGKELFYVSFDQKMMAVPVTAAASFEAGTPAALFSAPFPSLGITSDRIPYAVSADGQRFLVRRVVEEKAQTPITVALDWTAGVKK